MKINILTGQKIIVCVALFVIFGLSGCNQVNPPIKNEPAAFIPLTAGTQEVRGKVLGGDDQTPEGLMDSPRTYIYQVRLDSGEEINVSYTAYPPSSASQNQPGPQLTFYNGVILAGDYMVAQGTYNANTRTLNVALESDYIETLAEKP